MIEENAGSPLSRARAALIDAASGAKAAMGFEDGPGDPTRAVIARRGDVDWTLTTTGRSPPASSPMQKL